MMAEKSEMESFVLMADDGFAGVSRAGRICITQRYVFKMKYREIAADLGCALGTVRSRINRAKHAILENRRKAEGPNAS